MGRRGERMMRLCVLALVLSTLSAVPGRAYACGCFTPSTPPTPNEPYAVSQQSEQIIFEVNGDGTTTAHVLIRYEGKPESFAWILPAVGVPELGLSPQLLFALVEAATAPSMLSVPESLCPGQEYTCEYASCAEPRPRDTGCDAPETTTTGPTFGTTTTTTVLLADAGAAADFGLSTPPVNVMVLAEEVVGDYQTIIFSAGDAAGAVQWLGDNGFIVAPESAPFMQPYADAGMTFVAIRLVAGATADAIRPLRMTYQGPPMIPLKLTAVSAEPELSVTAYVSADEAFVPRDQELIYMRDEVIGSRFGTVAYGAAMSRAIDEAGGEAFVAEFAGPLSGGLFRSQTCCQSPGLCNIGGDGECQCPFSPDDAVDCRGDGSNPDEDDAVAIFERLQSRGALTRLTTRLNPEEMSFDPVFEPGEVMPSEPLVASEYTLDGCLGDTIERTRAETVRLLGACETVYCGHGECVVGAPALAACDCDEGYVVRLYTDLDGVRKPTCVPRVPVVDYAAASVEAVADACFGVDCGEGSCVDHGGFAACDCDEGYAAEARPDGPFCREIVLRSGSAGGVNHSARLRDVRVCRPSAPICGGRGWLVARESAPRIRGEVCERTTPDPSRFEPVECPDDEGCATASPVSSASGAWLLVVAVVALGVLRRRDM